MGRTPIVDNAVAPLELGTCPRTRDIHDDCSGCWGVDLRSNVDEWSMESVGSDDVWIGALPVVDAGTREAHRFSCGKERESKFG